MTYCGSWKYSAPEILLQEEYDPPAVDVWSLGVMLFQMVAGRLPFSEVNESETLTKIMDGKYEMPEEISDPLKKLVVFLPSAPKVSYLFSDLLKKSESTYYLEVSFKISLIISIKHHVLDSAISERLSPPGSETRITR